MLPLDGFIVIDLTRYLSGPYCTMVLAGLGATVVKLEQPAQGDDARSMGPMINGESYPFAMSNHSKRSVSLDLKNCLGRAASLRLIERADVVVENFRPGVMDRLGLGYDDAKAVRNDIIYCSISGFGQNGPYRDRPGFDIMAQGLVGFLRMTGQPDRRPAKMGIAVNDLAAGATAVYSILAAHLQRQRTGTGQHIDISLVDAGLAWTLLEAGAYFANGEVPTQSGTRHRRTTPYQAYRTANGYVTIGAATERIWKRLVTNVLSRPNWLADPRYQTLADRMAHIDELERDIEQITATKTTEHWIALLDAAGVPCGPALTYDQTLADPHVRAREMVVEVEHPIIGPMRTLGQGAKFSELDFTVHGPAPWLGQHTVEVLTEFGFTADEVGELFAAGVAYDHHPDGPPAPLGHRAG